MHGPPSPSLVHARPPYLSLIIDYREPTITDGPSLSSIHHPLPIIVPDHKRESYLQMKQREKCTSLGADPHHLTNGGRASIELTEQPPRRDVVRERILQDEEGILRGQA